jgi:hypothetical protein
MIKEISMGNFISFQHVCPTLVAIISLKASFREYLAV